MLVYLIASIQFISYLLSVPLCVAFCLTTRGGLRVGVGVGAFERRFAMKRARKTRKPPKLPRGGGGPGMGLALQTLRRLRGGGLTLRGSLCLGDAAATAVACGALRALGTALGARAGRVEIDVEPVFNDLAPRARLEGMIRARAGQIIAAAALSGIESINRRIAQWTDTPSKA